MLKYCTRFLLIISLGSFMGSCIAQEKAKKIRVKRVQIPSVETIYDNVEYVSEIKTIEFFNTKKEQSFPIMNLGGDDRLVLKFDDLRNTSKNIYYTFEHCDADWVPSNITTLDFLDGLTNIVTQPTRFKNTFIMRLLSPTQLLECLNLLAITYLKFLKTATNPSCFLHVDFM